MREADGRAVVWGDEWIEFDSEWSTLGLAREAGFGQVEHVSAVDLGERYFAGRSDGLRPPKNAEELLIATA